MIAPGARTSLTLLTAAALLMVPSYAHAQLRPSDRVTTGDTVKRSARNAALRELRADIDAMVDANDLKGAAIGLCIVSLETGEIIAQRDAERYFTPASTQKLFTTAAALSLLGPDFRFHTGLYLDGTIHANGEFEGNIIIRGGADPTWSTTYARNPEDMMDRWVDLLDSLGIRSIKGTIIGDDDIVDDADYPHGWAWDDLAYAYAAQVGGLNIADNGVRLQVMTPRSVADIPVVRMKPQSEYLRVISALRVVDSSGATDVTPVRDFRSNVVDLVGSISTKAASDTVRLHVSVDNPTLYDLSLFRDALNRRSIRFRGSLIDVDDWTDPIDYERLRRIDDVVSPPLSEIVSTINHISHNLSAEILLKMIGQHVSGEGSFERGAEAVRLWTQREGIAANDLTITDGSGLSRMNLCTPKHLVALLGVMHRSTLGPVFEASLAAPGEEGTMKRRLAGSRAVKHVRAKTGSMNNISTLAGYVNTRDGEPFAFAIMMGNVVVPSAMAQNMQDLICMRLASFSRK